MLVLTRKVGEGIAIGDDIRIVVMQIKGKQVRLGIKADAGTSVHREEIYQKIQDENREASGTKAEDVDGLSDIFKNTKSDSSEGLNRAAPVRRQIRNMIVEGIKPRKP